MTENASPDAKATEFLEKLKKALSRSGDFPASARVVSQLRELVSNPDTSTNQVAELILGEPSLGARVLHVVNSSFYKRAKEIYTVSQAVVQIGMRPLAELCSGLILLQKFIPAARKGGPFATCLKRTITTALLTSSLTSEMNKDSNGGSEEKTGKDEAGYLTGSFAEMGTLLLAYYFPKLYESAEKRSQTKNQPLAKSIKELVGLSPFEISKEVISELKLPQKYIDVIDQGNTLLEEPTKKTSKAMESNKDAPLIYSLYAGSRLSTAITDGNSGDEIQDVLDELHNIVPLENVSMSEVLGSLTEAFEDYCSALELKLPKLPEELKEYREQKAREKEQDEGISESGEGAEESSPRQKLSEEEQFAEFVEEIRAAVENREPSASVITTVMETCAWGLGFDRVLLMLLAPGKKHLAGRMLLGNIEGFNPKEFTRPIGKEASSYAPDAASLSEGRPVYRGDPLFDEGWPFAAIPVGFDKRSVGVIYADRTNDGDKELSAREQAAISVLAELLDRSISMNS